MSHAGPPVDHSEPAEDPEPLADAVLAIDDTSFLNRAMLLVHEPVILLQILSCSRSHRAGPAMVTRVGSGLCSADLANALERSTSGRSVATTKRSVTT